MHESKYIIFFLIDIYYCNIEIYILETIKEYKQMKNLLSENMLRFGTKNLSEAAQRELVLKSVIETINEHGLHNAVRRHLMEQGKPDPNYLGYAKKIAGQLMTALGGADDEDGVLAALKSIKTYGGQPVYDNLLQLVKTSPKIKSQFGKNFKLVSSMIADGGISQMDLGYDDATSSPVKNPLQGKGLGIDRDYIIKFEEILQQYNPNEDDFTRGMFPSNLQGK